MPTDPKEQEFKYVPESQEGRLPPRGNRCQN
jgi:hypothetical protein